MSLPAMPDHDSAIENAKDILNKMRLANASFYLALIAAGVTWLSMYSQMYIAAAGIALTMAVLAFLSLTYRLQILTATVVDDAQAVINASLQN